MQEDQPKRKYLKVSVEMHNNLHRALNDGTLTIKQVMAQGISQTNAYNIKNYSAQTVKPTCGRKPKLTGKMKSCFYAKVGRGCFRSYKEAQEYLKTKYNLLLDVTSVGRMLRHRGYFSRVKREVIPLTEENIQSRLEHALELYQDPEKQRRIIYSDESTYYEVSSLKQRVIRKNGERLKLKNLTERRARSRHKLNLFGCTSLEEKGFIVEFEGNMNQHTYIRIIKERVVPFIRSHTNFQDMLFLQDNARYHTTKKVIDIQRTKIDLVRKCYRKHSKELMIVWTWSSSKNYMITKQINLMKWYVEVVIKQGNEIIYITSTMYTIIYLNIFLPTLLNISLTFQCAVYCNSFLTLSRIAQCLNYFKQHNIVIKLHYIRTNYYIT
ncbi:Conserved_hypothetical protein [Hexamita inflata]|uniref:Tc1-like transposase DDE domain-containing protein n=1 Tax=Hexamita inflata TaxID=28002 RepID=A0ABP1JZ85_9EUKA